VNKALCSGPDGQPVWSFCTKPVAMNMSRRRLSRVFTPQTCAFSHLRVHPHRLPICIMPLLLLGFSCGLSMQPAAVSTPRAPAASTPPGRREVLAGAGAAAAFALFGLPSSAQASYALYQASQDSYTDRKKTGFVPVATSDKETLRAIQQDLYDRKAQYRAVKAKKKPAQCCARSSTSWPSLRPAGAPVASLGARPRHWLPPHSGPGQPGPLVARAAPAGLQDRQTVTVSQACERKMRTGTHAWGGVRLLRTRVPSRVGTTSSDLAFAARHSAGQTLPLPLTRLLSVPFDQVLRWSDRGRAADAREYLRAVRPLEG